MSFPLMAVAISAVMFAVVSALVACFVPDDYDELALIKVRSRQS